MHHPCESSVTVHESNGPNQRASAFLSLYLWNCNGKSNKKALSALKLESSQNKEVVHALKSLQLNINNSKENNGKFSWDTYPSVFF
jgi:hypothetical protein